MELLPEAVFTEDELDCLVAALQDAMSVIAKAKVKLPSGIELLQELAEKMCVDTGDDATLEKIRASRATLNANVNKKGLEIAASAMSKLALYRNQLMQ